MSLDTLHKGLILFYKDKYMINSSNSHEQWPRDGCAYPSTKRHLLGVFIVKWGNAPLSPQDAPLGRAFQPKNLENRCENCQQQTNQRVRWQVLKRDRPCYRTEAARGFLRGLKGELGEMEEDLSWKPNSSARFNASCSTIRPKIAG